MTCTRPAIAVLARFMQEPRELHWRFMKRLLNYIETTMDYSLVYSKTHNSQLVGFTDSDYASDIENSHLDTYSCMVTVLSLGTAANKKQFHSTQ